MRLSEIAHKALEKIEKNLVSVRDIHENVVYEVAGARNGMWVVIGFTILVRLMVGLGGYSGENDSPNYGDFEAQRNWMSIAYHRHPENWYHETSSKPWWRLDYPPIAGYLSYFFAKFMKYIVPEGLAPKHGVESESLRLFMRMSVVISDLLFFYVPTIIYVSSLKLNQRVSNIILLFLLSIPGFILIDHGHFQYNCVMLGLVFSSFLSILFNQPIMSCIFFTIALSTKQMSMYYALAFFSILLGKALFNSRIINPSNYSRDFRRYNLFEFFTTVFSYAWIVVIVTVVLWMPWISYNNPKLILEPLQAIFPVHRGLYQLKVPNFWCATDIVMKWEVRFSSGVLLAMCAVLSLLFSIPSMIVSCLVQRPKFYLYALMNISISFFFFSFHVH
jgi:alpha-1,3-glucosyltransferase